MGKATKASSSSKEKQGVVEGTTTIANNADIQSWSEVPSIAHFCSLFRQAFDLLEFDIQELEESLLLMGTEDDTSQLVLRLLIKLLKGCSRTFTNNINEDVSIIDYSASIAQILNLCLLLYLIINSQYPLKIISVLS